MRYEKLGIKYAGEYGQADERGEQFFVKRSNQYFIYANGGSESKYIQPAIELFANRQAENRLKENINLK